MGWIPLFWIKQFLDQTVFMIKQFLDQYIFLRISDDFSLNQQLKHSVSTHKLTIIITFTSNRFYFIFLYHVKLIFVRMEYSFEQSRMFQLLFSFSFVHKALN